MKKLLSLILVLISIVSLSSCGKNPVDEYDDVKNNNDNQETNVTVKSNYSNLDRVVNNNYVSFSPNHNDNEGRLRANLDEKNENLEIVIEGYTTNYVSDEHDTVHVNLDLSSKVDYSGNVIELLEEKGILFNEASTTYDSIKNLIDNNYITYPTIKYWNYETISWTNEQEYDLSSKYEVKVYNNEEEQCGVFKFSIKFSWGSKFGNMNPCYYYDIDEVGSLVPHEEFISEIYNFHSMLCGLTKEQYDAISTTNYNINLKYIVVIDE